MHSPREASRTITCLQRIDIAAVGKDLLGRPRILKVGSYGQTAIEAVDNFAERVVAVRDDQIEWPADFSKEERNFQCLLGDTGTQTDDLGYVSNAGGKEKVILPTLRDRSFTIRERSTALYHRMCDNEWCKIRIVRVLDSSPPVSALEISEPPNPQGDVAIPVSKTTNGPTEAWIRDFAQAAALHMAWLLRYRGFRNHLKANGAQANVFHTDGAHTNSIRTNGAYARGAHTDGAHTNDACSIGTHTNGARTPESSTDNAHTDEHHTDDLHTDDPRTVSLQMDGLHTGDPHTEDPDTEDPHTEDPQISGLHPSGTNTDGTRTNGTHTNANCTCGEYMDCIHTNGRKRRRGNE